MTNVIILLALIMCCPLVYGFESQNKSLYGLGPDEDIIIFKAGHNPQYAVAEKKIGKKILGVIGFVKEESTLKNLEYFVRFYRSDGSHVEVFHTVSLEKCERLERMEDGAFRIIDLNGDGKYEILVRTSVTAAVGSFRIYTYEQEKIRYLGSIGGSFFTFLNLDRKTIIESERAQTGEILSCPILYEVSKNAIVDVSLKYPGFYRDNVVKNYQTLLNTQDESSKIQILFNLLDAYGKAGMKTELKNTGRELEIRLKARFNTMEAQYTDKTKMLTHDILGIKEIINKYGGEN